MATSSGSFLTSLMVKETSDELFSNESLNNQEEDGKEREIIECKSTAKFSRKNTAAEKWRMRNKRVQRKRTKSRELRKTIR